MANKPITEYSDEEMAAEVDRRNAIKEREARAAAMFATVDEIQCDRCGQTRLCVEVSPEDFDERRSADLWCKDCLQLGVEAIDRASKLGKTAN